MKGKNQNRGHPGRVALLDWKNYNSYIEKYTPDADDKTRFEFALNLKSRLNKNSYLMLIFPTF